MLARVKPQQHFISLICYFVHPTPQDTSVSSSPLLSWFFYKPSLSSNILLLSLNALHAFSYLNCLLLPSHHRNITKVHTPDFSTTFTLLPHMLNPTSLSASSSPGKPLQFHLSMGFVFLLFHRQPQQSNRPLSSSLFSCCSRSLLPQAFLPQTLSPTSSTHPVRSSPLLHPAIPESPPRTPGASASPPHAPALPLPGHQSLPRPSPPHHQPSSESRARALRSPSSSSALSNSSSS